MSKSRKANGQFKAGHHKIAKRHGHHKHRKNPIAATTIARLAAKLRGASGVGRAARILVVRA